jgi:hypothetical protein
VATETDAARDRVLAARSDLGEELHRLEASARDAVDIPAKIRRSPGKAAAAVGGVAFLALKGPQRLFRLGSRVVRGKPAAMPSSMLPKDVDKTLRKLGHDGDQVRGTIERDFAAYLKKAQADRRSFRTLMILTVGRPILDRAARAAADFIFTPNEDSFSERLSQVKAKAERGVEQVRDEMREQPAATSTPPPADPVDDEGALGI